MSEGLLFSKDHEWVRVEGKNAFVGITDYACSSLGDIVYVELPTVGKILAKNDVLGVVESVKAASDIFSPVTGRVLEVNDKLNNVPEILSEKPFENYIAIIELDENITLEGLMNEDEYKKFIGK